LEKRSNRQHYGRLILAVAFIVILAAAGRLTGVRQYFTPENVRGLVLNVGIWGYVLFIVVFSVGEVLHVFGLIFVAAGVYAFGRTTGLIMGIIGGIVAVSVSFLVMRGIGGSAFTRVDRPWVQGMLKKLDQMPVRIVIVLRLIFIMNPSLNYLLALTSIRFRDYLIGSAIGLVAPISIFVFCFDWLVNVLM
jgi:uncharacterized membrane protein YdjX (TVP38/TMEM64 family)